MLLLSFLKEAMYVNLNQFHRLVTHEDGIYYHLHKTLGISVLSHFAYRTFAFAKFGTMGFDGSWTTLFWIFVHAALHVSSFEFILPSRRNKVYNIIWHEMRWHSMIFAYRSIVLMLLMWFSMNSIVAAHIVAYARGPIVIATMMFADYATWYYKTIDAVEKSDSTMRGNPYPSYIPQNAIKFHNMFYSVSQALATSNILYRGFDTVFLQLLAIQTAPFGMTLVKKGVFKQAGWHWTYTLALLMSYLYGYIIPNEPTRMFYWTTVAIFCVSRFKFHTNKYVLWIAAVVLQWYIMHANVDIYENLLHHSISALVWK